MGGLCHRYHYCHYIAYYIHQRPYNPQMVDSSSLPTVHRAEIDIPHSHSRAAGLIVPPSVSSPCAPSILAAVTCPFGDGRLGVYQIPAGIASSFTFDLFRIPFQNFQPIHPSRSSTRNGRAFPSSCSPERQVPCMNNSPQELPFHGSGRNKPGRSNHPPSHIDFCPFPLLRRR